MVPVRSCTAEQLAPLFSAGGWPAFIDADEVAAAALPRVRDRFGDHELALVDAGDVVAAGWGVPLRWDASRDALPAGYSDSLTRALVDHDHGVEVDTFVLCAAQVRAERGGGGLAAELISALVRHAAARGLDRVIAPLRPTLKHRYPLVPIDEYVGWTRDDGEPADPWLRLHRRLGAEVIATCPASQVFTGTVTAWRQWTGLPLATDGRHLVPEALAPLDVDLGRDEGRLVEPGVWVRHR